MISIPNILKGKVLEIRAGMSSASVKIDLGNDQFITTVIPKEDLELMGIEVGKEAWAIINSTDLRIGVD